MTRDELNRKRMMFQIYANRNKMPQLQKNDNEEPIAHSATNDFLEYRKKVAAGMRMQRENNKSNLFNVTAANEQYHQDLMDQNIIIHAGMNNQYIAKLDDFYGKGKPRYFYDQAEWDNYRKNMQGARQSGADRGAREGADAKNKNLANKAQEAFTNTNRNSALNTAQSRREEAVNKSQKDLYNKALASEALKGKNGAIVNRMTSLGKAQSGRESAINNSESSVKSNDNEKSKTPEIVQEAQSGRENAIKRSDPKYQKELEKAKSIKSDKDRWGAYSQKDIESVTSNDKRFNTIKTEDDAVNYPGGIEKLYNDIEAALEEKYPEKKKNYEAAKNAGADRAVKEKENAEKEKENSELYKIKKDVVKDAKKPGTTVKDLADKYELPEAYVNYIVYDETGKNIPEDKYDLDTHREMNALRNKRSKEGAIERSKKSAKHSSLEDGITTSDDITPDQEYLNFRARVEAGMKHFGMTRGLMSIPVNQALKNGESLSHAGYKPAGTHEYVAKIDNAFGPGKHRYFYSKEEWDNYNNYKRNEGYAQNAEANKAKKEKYNANYESNIKKNEGYAQNAGADRAKQEKLSKQQEESQKIMDDIFEKSKKINLLVDPQENTLGLRETYAHDAYSKALADVNGYTEDDLKKDPGLRSKLMDEGRKNPENTIKLSESMNKNFEDMVTADAKKVMDSLKYVKSYYHNGNATGKGSTYSTAIPTDGLVIAKNIEQKYNESMNKNKDNQLNGYIDFISSLSKDEREVLSMSYNYYKNNLLPGGLRNAQESREEAEKSGQRSIKRENERYKYHYYDRK